MLSEDFSLYADYHLEFPGLQEGTIAPERILRKK